LIDISTSNVTALKTGQPDSFVLSLCRVNPG